MHHALRDPLTVEARELLQQVLVLEEERATDAGGGGVLVVGDGGAGPVVSTRFDIVTFRTGALLTVRGA
ncbi:hypothetical protein STANM309S_05396 [Streptomyces tanashiensis]